MKKHYFLIFLILFVFSFSTSAQIRFVEVDPATDRIKIKNFSTTTIDISSHWICSRFDYAQLSGMTLISGSLNLSPGAEVVFTSSVSLYIVSADLALYSNNSFASSASMVDFFQYGAGGIGRESLAVTAGLWTTGDFISEAGPYRFSGSASERGSSFWQSTLTVSEANELKFQMYPNPSAEGLNIQLPSGNDKAEASVFDNTGRLIKSQEVTLSNSRIDITDLSVGTYIIRIATKDKVGIQQFIKS